MGDFTNWNLRGPVRLMREEMTQRDPQTGAWHQPRQRPAITFRPDGKTESIEGSNPDGTAFRKLFTYDASGNLVKTQFRLGDGPPTTTTLEMTSEVAGANHTHNAWRHGNGCRRVSP